MGCFGWTCFVVLSYCPLLADIAEPLSIEYFSKSKFDEVIYYLLIFSFFLLPILCLDVDVLLLLYLLFFLYILTVLSSPTLRLFTCLLECSVILVCLFHSYFMDYGFMIISSINMISLPDDKLSLAMGKIQ